MGQEEHHHQQQGHVASEDIAQELVNVISDVRRKQECRSNNRAIHKNRFDDCSEQHQQQPPYFGPYYAERQAAVSTKGARAVRVTQQRSTKTSNLSQPNLNDESDKLSFAMRSSENFVLPGAVHHAPGQTPMRARPAALALLFAERIRRGASPRDDDEDVEPPCGVHKEVDGELVDFTGNSSSRCIEGEIAGGRDSYSRMNVFKHRADGVKGRQSQKRQRRIILCTVLGVLIVVGIVAGVVVGMNGQGKKSPTTTTTTSVPEDDEGADFVSSVIDCVLPADIGSYKASERMKMIESTIVAELPSMASTIYSPGTSARAALCWIADVDSFESSGEAFANLIQRFTMGFIYYHFVLDLDSKSDSKLPASNWLYAIHECEWDYVDCDGGNEVAGLHMSQLGLGGNVPSELVFLKGLTNLELHANLLVGTIPSEIWTMERLETIDIGTNFLSGTLASEVRNLTQLRNFYAGCNKLSGTIPNLGDLPKLKSFRLGNSEITGMFPSFEGTTNLETLLLSGLQLSPTIPSSLGSLTKLTFLEVSAMGIGGSIPTEIGMLTELRTLRLERLSISGSIPTETGQLTHLTHLSLDGDKRLSGRVPSEIGLLTNLEQLLLGETGGFTGSMPAEVCSLRSHKLTLLVEFCSTCSSACPDM